MATAISSPFATLPDDLQQRVLAGIPLDDQQATAAACKAFRAVIHGPKFLALRRRYGFAEGGVVVVESKGHQTAPYMSLKIITSGITTIIFQGLRVSSYGSTVTPLQHACVHNGRIIVFLKDKTLERAADGSWAPYEGAADLDPPDGWGPHNAVSASVLLG